MKRIFILTLLIISFFTARAQSPRLKILSVETDTNLSCIKVKYNLKGHHNFRYLAWLSYSNNGGHSFRKVRSVSGDIGDSIIPGKDKTVNWAFLKDNPYFTGKNIIFRIESQVMDRVATGGPENAWLSLLVPGLGDPKVRNGLNYGLITAATYGLLASGIIFNFHSQNLAHLYNTRVPNTEKEHENLYVRAHDATVASQILLISGFAVWAADIIGVYRRGLENKRMGLTKNQRAMNAWAMPGSMALGNGTYISAGLNFQF